MTGGYPGGFLRTSMQPKYSVNLHLGTRWLNDKLELGSRWLYSSEVENKDEKWLKENKYTTPILKWETREWGEIPADFGRK